MATNVDLVKGGIVSSLVRFAVPVFLSSLLQVLYSAVDLVIVGRFAATADMSAVAVSSGIMMMVTMGVSGLTTGLTVLLGQFSGAGNHAGIRRSIGTSVVFFAALSAVVTLLLAALSGPIVGAMQTPAEAVRPARDFLTICAMGTVFIVGYNVVSSIFRGVGNSKTPLVFVAVACVVNIILYLLFITSFRMGAAGAALATVIAQGLSVFLSVLYIRKKDIGLRVRRGDLRLDRAVIGRLLKIGAPISLQELLINFSFILITAVVNKLSMDDPALSAAVGTVERLMGFLAMPAISLSMAVATMAAHNFGARQFDRARKCLWTGIGISALFAAVSTVFCWIFPAALPSLFSSDPSVVYEASLYLKTYVFDSIGVAFVFNLNGFFSALGRSVFSMAHSIATTVLIRIPFVLIAGGIAGVTLLTIGCAAPLTSLGSIIVCLIYYRRLVRKMSMSPEELFLQEI